MENSFQTSFIPKKPITASTGGRDNRAQTSIFTILAFFLLVVMGMAAGGLFLYKNYLLKQKETLSLTLEKVRDSFEKDTIDELELYDKRVSASRKILDNHIVLSPMFSLLGTLTIPSIQYTKFTENNGTSGFSVNMSGVASDYRSIALQADVFNSAKGRFFKNVVFSNLAKDKNNRVVFDLQFDVDPALLSYEKNLVLEQLQAKIQPTPSTTTPAEVPTNATIPTTLDNNAVSGGETPINNLPAQ